VRQRRRGGGGGGQDKRDNKERPSRDTRRVPDQQWNQVAGRELKIDIETGICLGYTLIDTGTLLALALQSSSKNPEECSLLHRPVPAVPYDAH
jgi:hypothetical protein